MKYTSFFVPGKPQGKARPRVTLVKGHAHAYTPKTTKEYEQQIRDAYIESGGDMFDTDIPLHVIVDMRFTPPKNTPKKRYEDVLVYSRPLIRPDVDNVLKTVLDALNGVAYEDDKQVVDVILHKRYDREAGIKVVVSDGSI